MGDARCQDIVKGRDTVGGDKQQAIVIELVDVSDLAAGVEWKVREVSLQEDGIEKFGAHDEILQARERGVF